MDHLFPDGNYYEDDLAHAQSEGFPDPTADAIEQYVAILHTRWNRMVEQDIADLQSIARKSRQLARWRHQAKLRRVERRRDEEPDEAA